jgi:hypothetical protein
MPETTYIVLRQREHLPGEALDVGTFGLPWTVEKANVAASTAEAAIRHACNDKDADGVYVAVPARSWKPVKVAAVQTTALKLESADTRTKETA